ncbi:MAG TPA: extracellular solute-binding protein [Clostridiaceae bacterium]|nr:extracellular solute-binding protein [Clostridiaceae bacterium]
MKSKWTLIISLILVICFMGSMLSGCVVQPQQTNSDDSRGDTIDDGTKTYVYSVNILGAEKEWLKDEKLKRWREQFKIEFNFLPVNWNDWGQKVRIWMSSGDIPDIVWIDFGTSMAQDYYSWVEAGLIRELKGTEKYQYVHEQLEKMKLDDILAVDGKKYLWPCTRDATIVDNISNRGFLYRRDWAEKLGLAKDDNTYTWDEMVEFARQCIEKDPGNAGKNKIAGMGCQSWAWPSSMGIEQMTGGITGANGYFLTANGYEWNARAPEYLEGIKIVKQLYDSGIIWVDQPLAKGDEAVSKFLAGELAILYDNVFPDQLAWFRKAMKENIPGFEYDDIQFMKVKSPNGRFVGIKNTEYWCISVFSAEMSDAKFDRLMKAWDWMLSPEGYYTRQIGIRGIDWEFEGDGVKYLWPYNSETQRYERPADYPLDLGRDAYLSIGVTEGFGFINPNYEGCKSGKDAYDYCIFLRDNGVLVETDYNIALFRAENKDKYGSFARDISDKVIQIIIDSKYEDVEKEWNAFLESKKAQVDLVIKELNDGLLGK